MSYTGYHRNYDYNILFVSMFLPELQRIKQSPMKLGQVFMDHVSSSYKCVKLTQGVCPYQILIRYRMFLNDLKED